MSTRISLNAAQTRLLMLWMAGAAVVFLLMLAQTVGGKYGGQAQRAWGLVHAHSRADVVRHPQAQSRYGATRPMEEQTVEQRAAPGDLLDVLRSTSPWFSRLSCCSRCRMSARSSS